MRTTESRASVPETTAVGLAKINFNLNKLSHLLQVSDHFLILLANNDSMLQPCQPCPRVPSRGSACRNHDRRTV